MKGKSVIKIFVALGLLLTAIFAFCFGHETEGSITLAMTAGVGTEGILSVEAALKEAEAAGIETIIDEEFEDKVVQFFPDIMPLDTLIRKIGKRRSVSVLDPKLFSVDYKQFSDSTQTAVTGGTTVTTAAVKVGDTRLFSKGDLIQFEGINGYDKNGIVTPYTNLWGLVYDVSASTGLSVQPINGKLNAAMLPTFNDNIPINTVVYRGSKPGTELQMKSASYFALPEDDFNYVQKFLGQVDVSDWSEMHLKKAKWGKSEIVNRAMYDYRATKEFAYLRGFRDKIVSQDPTVTEEIRLCGGFTFFNKKAIDWTLKTAITDKDYVEFTENIFDGNSGSNRRILFAGSKLLTALQNSQAFSKNLEAQKTDLVGGVKMTVIQTVYGELAIYRHPLFREIGWGNAGVVLDFDHVSELQFESLRRKEIDYKLTGEKQATGTIFWETACPQFSYPDTHRFVIGVGGLA